MVIGLLIVDSFSHLQEYTFTIDAGHAVVASFSLNRPKSFLNEHLTQLQEDIFQEMSYISINVCFIFLS